MKTEPLEGRREAHEQEQDWITRIRAGGVDAFTEVFHAYYNRLCVFAEGFVHSPDAAEEVVEDVFVRLWEGRERWEVHGSLKGYLYTAVRNGALKHLRDHGTRERLHQGMGRDGVPPGMGEPAPAADEALHGRELAAVVERTISGLPERRREAFLLARRHGLSDAEIGAVMDISPATARKHITQAVRALRDTIERWMR